MDMVISRSQRFILSMPEKSFCTSREDFPISLGPLLRDGLLENRDACIFTDWVREVGTNRVV